MFAPRRPSPLPAALAALVLLLVASGRAGDSGSDLELARDFEARIQAVIARVHSTVVTVGVPREGELRALRSGGSGVILADGFVLTCEHVTEGERDVVVGLSDGRTLDARVVGRDTLGDIALLQVADPRLPHATLGDSNALRAGDPVIAMGNPFGLAKEDHEPAATLGIVSATHRYQDGSKIYGDALQIDAAVNPGNSGGPLFDLRGRLVGINGRISVRGLARHNVGVGFAVPIHQVSLILDALREGRDVERGYLGARFLKEHDGLAGALLVEVIAGGPAAIAGLRVDDRILSVQGRAVEHPMRLANFLSVLPAGARVELDIQRGGQRLALEVVLGKRSP